MRTPEFSETDEPDHRLIRWPSFGLLVSLISALLGVYLLFQYTSAPPTVRYRVCNGTSVPLKNVQVLGFKDLQLGVGEFSAYREGAGLVREVGVRVSANGKNLETIFDDHFGEPLLPKGTYTIAIILQNSSQVRAVVSDGSQCK